MTPNIGAQLIVDVQSSVFLSTNACSQVARAYNVCDYSLDDDLLTLLTFIANYSMPVEKLDFHYCDGSETVLKNCTHAGCHNIVCIHINLLTYFDQV